MAQAIAQQGDTIDLICWRVLGSTDGVTEAALDLNRDLAALDVVIDAGTIVKLPDIVAGAAAKRETIQLWD